MFHHWMVASRPPLKHCSPLEVIANDNTGPLQREKSIITRALIQYKQLLMMSSANKTFSDILIKFFLYLFLNIKKTKTTLQTYFNTIFSNSNVLVIFNSTIIWQYGPLNFPDFFLTLFCYLVFYLHFSDIFSAAELILML